jgi:hypothetical protein
VVSFPAKEIVLMEEEKITRLPAMNGFTSPVPLRRLRRHAECQLLRVRGNILYTRFQEAVNWAYL